MIFFIKQAFNSIVTKLKQNVLAKENWELAIF